uniref:SapC family protein n=1 Tax=uncultured Halomonas sp. TaxID=173971 RepID=UPI002632B226|nr:SapC family protein [uncultured Halomonas sp.]
MPQPLVLSPRECQGKAWHPPRDPSFAQHRALIPLHAGELAKAAAVMPLAAVKEGREWRLVGVCGLAPDHNLFVRQDQWLGHYRPEWFSTFPFEITSVGDKGLVAFDRDSGLLAEEGQAGEEGAEAFFDADGQMTQAVATRVEALKAAYRKQQATHKALQALGSAGVLVPWPEALRSQLGLSIEGLHIVDEKALSELEDEAFLALRRAQALTIAYALNLAIPQTHLLARLARMTPARAEAPEGLDDFFGDDEELSFDFGN